MEYQIPLTYSETLLREAAARFWWRVIGWKFLIAMGSAIASFIYLLIKGDSSWVVGLLGTALGFVLIFMIALYFVHYRNSLRKFRQMGSPEAAFTASESSFTLSSGAGTSTLQWSTIVEVWQFPSFWLLFFSKAQFSTLPLARITPEAQAFILRQVSLAGGKVS